MRFLPLGIDVRDRTCVVVGGGTVATRKVLTLLGAGAAVTVVAPAITEALRHEVDAGRVVWRHLRFSPEHLDGAFLTVLATDDVALNAGAARMAAERGVLACDASSAEDSQVIFGALLEHRNSILAAFTDGRDPGEARRTRDRVGRLLAGGVADEPGVEGREPTGRGIGGDNGRDVLILAAHGSRDPRWSAPLERLAASVEREVACAVRLAYVQFAAPTLAEAATQAIESGANRISVLPLFMTETGHVERDVRPVIEALHSSHPDARLELLPPVGQHALFRRALVDIAKEGGS